MKRGLCVVLLLLVACAGQDYAGEAGRGARGLKEVQPSSVLPGPSRAVAPVSDAPVERLSVPGSRAGARGCVDFAGKECNRNVCGGTGVFDCKGVCSAAAPVVPKNLAAACNRNACGGTGTVLCDGSCSASAPAVPSDFGKSCCGGGTIQCSGQCSTQSCPQGQICQNNVCITVKQGYCGACESNSQCLSGFCYYGSCINRGDELSGWANFAYCSDGVFCEEWQKPVRIVRANFGCRNMFQRGEAGAFTAQAVAYYKGKQVWSQSFTCSGDPFAPVTYINWAPPYLGWVDKVVTNTGGSLGIVEGQTSPCSRVTDYFTSQ